MLFLVQLKNIKKPNFNQYYNVNITISGEFLLKSFFLK